MRIRYEYTFINGNGGIPSNLEWKKVYHEHITFLFAMVATVIVGLTFYFGGVFTLLRENDFKNFSYPLDIPNFRELIEKLDDNFQRHLLAANSTRPNYKSIVDALKTIRINNRSVDDIVPLAQFENLEYSININSGCSEHSNITSGTAPHLNGDELISVIIVVKSAANNYVRRQAIRETWFANGTNHFEFRFKTIFMLGACDLKNPVPKLLREKYNGTWTPEDCWKAITNESLHHGDLVQSTGIDSYYNNTIKSVMTLRWLSVHCDGDFFLSLDDDFVFEKENLMSFLLDLHRAPHYVSVARDHHDIGPHGHDYAVLNQDHKSELATMKKLAKSYLYAGHVRDYVHPHRHMTSKWYISREEYPYNKYPRFASGGAILMSFKTVRHFALATYFTQTFKFDDVYIGIMARKLGMESLHDENFMCVLEDYLATEPERLGANDCIGVHDIKPDQLVNLWTRRRALHPIISRPH